MKNYNNTDKYEKNKNISDSEGDSLLPTNVLLKTGLNFGGEKKYWNARNKPYIYMDKIVKDAYTGRNKKIKIFNSKIIKNNLLSAYNFLIKLSQEGGAVLYVGTEPEFLTELIQEEAERSQSFYINHRWQGGTLTNFKTIRAQVKHMVDIEKLEVSGKLEKYSKNERLKIRKEYYKLKRKLIGIRKMTKLPSALIVFNQNINNIAIKEAINLNIPVISIVNSNCDPSGINYVIPGNNIGKKSLYYFVKVLTDAIVTGKKLGNIEVAFKEDIDFDFLKRQSDDENEKSEHDENESDDNK